MDLGVEGKRVAIEAIATLVNVKNVMGDLILRPAGIPHELYRPLLYQRDDGTGRPLSKRQIAPLILAEIEKRPDFSLILRKLVEIAANWTSFELAQDEYVARGTVQKARDILGQIEIMEAREAKQRELARKEELARMEREKADLFRKGSELLMMMFDELTRMEDVHKRGYLLQDLLNRTFDLHDIPVIKSFTRNEGAEQIDGGIILEGWHYLVECRWRQKLANIRELDGLNGQVERSGKQAMGLFLSIEGWSEHVPPLLKQNSEKSIILMDGYDLHMVLSTQKVDLRDFILAKAAHLTFGTEPFLSIKEYLKNQA